MRILLFVTLLFVHTAVFAQTSFLKEAVSKLDKALVSKDTVTLKQLLHKNLSYGHSNAWVENKQEVISDLVSGKLSYLKIESRDQKWETDKDWATVRSTTEIRFKLDGKEGELKMHVLQVWMKTNKGWQLLARQSTKL